MSGPVLVQATGSYRSRAPCAPLRQSFASAWTHRMDGMNAPPVLITPDATIDLQWIGGAFRIAGPDRDPQTEFLPAGELVIGLRFRPAAASAWLGVSLAELVGQRLPLEDVWGRRARSLAGGVRADDDPDTLLASLETAVTGEGRADAGDAAMQEAFHLVERGAPPDTPLVPWLIEALDMSERTLRRRFDEYFGYGPKTLDRILRYQRFLRLASGSGSPVALLASEAGYADQAHLVRESRRLTGSTPRQIDRLLSGV